MIYIKKGNEPDSLTKYRKKKFAYYDGYKDKEMPQEEMQKAQLILQTNVERSREIKEQYPLTLKPWER